MHLKNSIKDWWNEHLFIYNKKRGAVAGEFNEEFFQNIDRKVLKWMSPWAHTNSALLSNLIDFENLKGKKILDIAVGTGWTTESFCRAGADVIAIDITPRAVETTKKRLELRGLSARVFEADQENLPFPDESFDYVLAWGCQMHTPGTQEAINEVYRVLKKGGRAGSMMYNKNSLHWKYFIWFGKGVARLKLLKYTEQELANRYTDGFADGGNMLTKFYTPDEAKDMYGKFGKVKISIFDSDRMMNYFPHRRLPVGKLLPLEVKRKCARKWGQTLWVEAEK